VLFHWLGPANPEPGLKVLRVGVEPDQASTILQQRYAPLIDYLSAQTGIEARLIIPADYAESVRMIGEDKVDIANLGGLSFVEAQSRYRSTALVMREVDTRFTSWFLARPELANSALSDLRGKTIAFGNNLSTSGHLMPRFFLQQQWKIEPEDFFGSVVYSGTHDRTVQYVRDGTVDVGAANSTIVRKMLAEGRIGAGEIQVLWQTPPYPDYVWTVRSGLAESDRIRLRNAFLRLDRHDPADRRILASLDAEAFMPANAEDFVILQQIASRLGLTGVDSR